MEDKPGYYYTNDQGITFLTRCPKCDTENYAPMIATGICYRCRYEPKKDKELKHE